MNLSRYRSQQTHVEVSLIMHTTSEPPSERENPSLRKQFNNHPWRNPNSPKKVPIPKTRFPQVLARGQKAYTTAMATQQKVASAVHGVHRQLNAVVVSAGLMEKTVKVRIATQKWNSHIKKVHSRPIRSLAPSPILPPNASPQNGTYS